MPCCSFQWPCKILMESIDFLNLWVSLFKDYTIRQRHWHSGGNEQECFDRKTWSVTASLIIALLFILYFLFQSMVAFLKDPTGAPLWEENPEAKDVVHIETEKVSISFRPDEDQLSVLGVRLVWELHAGQKQWVRQSARSTRLFFCLQRPRLAVIQGQEHFGAYAAYENKQSIPEFGNWQPNLWKQSLIGKRVNFSICEHTFI